MRDQLLNGELFDTLKEAQIIIERWRIHDNTGRPHSRLGGQPPAPETLQLAEDSQGGWYNYRGRGNSASTFQQCQQYWKPEGHTQLK